MAAFKDTNGAEWHVIVHAESVEDVKAARGIDLRSPGAFNRLADDVILTVDVLWVLCREQAELAGISSKQFGELLAGVMPQAAAALIAATLDSLPASQRRSLQALHVKHSRLARRAKARAILSIKDRSRRRQALQSLEQQTRTELEAALARRSALNGGDA